MRGILINNEIHTGSDLGLVMTEKSIPPPTVQTYYVDVPGRNGSLDLSEALTGEITYSNRQLNFKFLGNGSREEVLALIDTMMAYHGQKLQITTDDYPDWYYTGRASITHTDNWNYVEFEVAVNAQPFSYALYPKVYEFSINGTRKLVVNNVGQNVIPTVTVDGETAIIFNDKRISLNSGTYTSASLKLPTGATTLTFEGNSNVKLTYREAVI